MKYEMSLLMEKILSFSCTLCWLQFIFLDCPSMPPYQLQPCLHISKKPSMPMREWNFLKQKSKFETYEKWPDLTTISNFLNLKFSSLWFESISLSLPLSLSRLHHPHNPKTHVKFPKNCLIWEKKTINPKL